MPGPATKLLPLRSGSQDGKLGCARLEHPEVLGTKGT